MKIAIGSDHAGFDMKGEIVAYLKTRGVEVLDMGPADRDSVDYPDFGRAVCLAVTGHDADRGILICGTGLGMSIVANKFPGIRAALCSEPLSARMSRLHNDANVLVMGGRMIGLEMAKEIAAVWLDTRFEGDRHQRRLDKIIKIEERFRN